MKELHIAFVGGGTVGHVSPLLAVMEAVQEQAKKQKRVVRCSYIGLPSDLESPVIKESNLQFDCYAVDSGKLHRHLTWNQLKQTVRLVRGMGQAKKLMRQLKPDIVFAKGGYSTVPVTRAAAQLHIPIFCHESDAILGLANRLTVKNAKTIFTTYPASAYPQLPAEKIVETGQPVRDMFYQQATKLPMLGKQTLNPKLPVVTVIGGSQGGRRMNQLVQGAWEELLPDFQIVQLTGTLDHAVFMDAKEKLPKKIQANLHLHAFLTDELPALFQKSAVVISRAGGTIAELAASRACALLVPLSTAAQNHQIANARILERAGAAVVLDETAVQSQDVAALVRHLHEHVSEQTSLRVAIGEFDHPDAAARMAAYLLG